jgi:hypothetical protein
MPKIDLKPNSAEYADQKQTHNYARRCDMPGCGADAEHKAPKSRQLDDYFHFCFEHISAYNKAWNYFSGMSDREIEDHIIRSAFWDRPTWRFDNYKEMEDELRAKGRDWREGMDDKARKENDARGKNGYRYTVPPHSPEFDAMALMGLEPPLSLDKIKKRYKELAKKHHPDVNQNDPKSEELLKHINMAYTILKMAHEKYALIEE